VGGGIKTLLKSGVNTYLWLKDFDFLVLMKKYPDGRRRLLTSLYIDYSNYRRKLEKNMRGG